MEKELIALIPGTSYRATSTGLVVNRHGRPLVGRKSGNYMRHSIRVHGRTKSINTARAVYSAFHGSIPKGLEIDHIDGNPLNNNLTNLRVVTHKENMNNPVTRTRMKGPKRKYSVIYDKID